MKNVVIIACLLFGAFLVAVLCGADQAFAGRVGISAVFFFTALGHFAKPEEMMHMLPAGVAATVPHSKRRTDARCRDRVAQFI